MMDSYILSFQTAKDLVHIQHDRRCCGVALSRDQSQGDTVSLEHALRLDREVVTET